MAKQTYQVTQYRVDPSGDTYKKPVKSGLTAGRANQLREKLEEQNSCGEADILEGAFISYLVERV